MGAWDGLNRRRFPRVNYPCQIIIRDDDAEDYVLLTHTENLGTGGVCIILKKGLKAFSAVDVELDLMDFQKNIKCRGKVVWSIRRKDTEEKKPMFYDTGIEFVNLEDNDRARLETIIQKLVKQGRTTPYR